MKKVIIILLISALALSSCSFGDIEKVTKDLETVGVILNNKSEWLEAR